MHDADHFAAALSDGEVKQCDQTLRARHFRFDHALHPGAGVEPRVALRDRAS